MVTQLLKAMNHRTEKKVIQLFMYLIVLQFAFSLFSSLRLSFKRNDVKAVYSLAEISQSFTSSVSALLVAIANGI